jgi:hypothetical protein
MNTYQVPDSSDRRETQGIDRKAVVEAALGLAVEVP